MGQQIQQLLQLLQQKETEIKRLEELCEKNKVEYKPKQSTSPTLPETKK